MQEPLIKHMQSIVKLTQKEVDQVKMFWSEKKIKKNDFLFRNGEVCQYDSFVLSGALKAFYINPQTGKEEILFFAIENWWATDIDSFANKTPSIYNLQALESSILLQVHYQAFEEMLLKIPKLERYFRIILQNYTASIQKRIVLAQVYDAKHRYWSFAQKYPEIIQRIPQYLIASYLGISPEFLSRIRAQKN